VYERKVTLAPFWSYSEIMVLEEPCRAGSFMDVCLSGGKNRLCSFISYALQAEVYIISL
jgi:hypothetical protein